MRRVMHGDLVAAARALLPVPPAQRGGQIARWLAEAHAADRHFFSPLWAGASALG